MATLTHRTELALAEAELLALDDVRGARLRLVEGSIWLTLDRDLRDIFLEPGDSFVVDRDGVTLLHALAPTRLQVENDVDATVPALRGGWRHAVARLAKRLPWPAPPSGLAGA